MAVRGDPGMNAGATGNHRVAPRRVGDCQRKARITLKVFCVFRVFRSSLEFVWIRVIWASRKKNSQFWVERRLEWL
jgi:hypothetical protein